MGVRTAERITGVSMEGLRSKQHYIGCGRQALRCEKAKHNTEVTEGRTRRTQRRRRDDAETQSERTTTAKREGTTWLCLPRLYRDRVSSWRRQRSLDFRRRSGRRGRARQYQASGS